MLTESLGAGGRIVVLCLLLSCLLAISNTGLAQEATISLDQYRQLLTETRAAAEAAQEESSQESIEELRSLASRWAAVSAVTTVEGTTVAVNHDRLLAALQAPDPDLEALLARLEALESLQERWPNAAYDTASAAQARTQLQEILERPQFQWQAQQPSLLEELWQRALRFLFNLIPEEVVESRLLGPLLAVLGVLILAALLIYVGHTFLGNLSSSVEQERRTVSGPDLASEAAFREAQDRSRRGDLRSAVRYLYLSTLLTLDERGLLTYDRTRTNREYLRSVANRPELLGTLSDVIDLFDRVWYGYRSIDQTTYERFEAQVQDLRELR